MSIFYDILRHTKNPVNVIQYSTNVNTRNHYPSVVNLGGDNLLCAFIYYGTVPGDLEPKRIYGKYSTDNGVEWGDPFLMIDARAGKLGVECPSLFRRANGDLICITLEREDDATYYGQIYQYVSDDNGLTWDAGTLIYESSDYETNDYLWIPSHNILVTATGRLIISIMTSTSEVYYTDTANTIVRHLYSDNEGASWSLSATVLQAAVSGVEGLIGSGRMIQMSNGTIVEIFRTRSRFTRVTKSTDNGATWVNPPVKSDTLIISNADVELYCKSDVLYAFVSRPNADVPQTAQAGTRLYLDLWKSVDAGDTWTLVKNLLYKDGKYIYTEAIVYDVGDGIMMFHSYYRYGTDTQDLRFERYAYTDLA